MSGAPKFSQMISAIKGGQEGDPKPEVVGELKAKGPAMTAWNSPDGDWSKVIEMEQGPPPWEILTGPNPSDARNFVECPEEWVLRWINPRVLDAWGWRGWKSVHPSDPRVRILVPSMVTVDNLIRRGGQGGDILTYMPKHWYEERMEARAQRTTEQTQASVDRLQSLKEDFARGKYGPNVSLEGRHPTHTMIHPDELKGVRD